MIAEVVPAIRLPKNVGIFSYKIPAGLKNKIKKGQVVRVSFRQKNVEGIVWKIKKTESRIKYLKEIKEIVEPKIIFSSRQLGWFEWLAQYYYVSLGLIVKTALPLLPKRKFDKFKEEELEIKSRNYKISAGEKKKVQMVLAAKNNFFLFEVKNQKKKLAFYQEFFKQLSSKNKHALILVPRIHNLKTLITLLEPSLRQKTAILQGKTTSKGFYIQWLKIKENKANLIIGTRAAIFAPTEKLDYIIIDEEESPDHKQWDQNPRYDARTAAFKLAEIYQLKIIFSSAAPRINSWYEARHKKYKLLTLGGKSKVKICLVDLEKLFRAGNYSLLTEELSKAIIKTLGQKRQVFLFLNRRGLATFTFCANCHRVQQCPDCKIPLVKHGKDILLCHHCQYVAKASSCLNCQGVNLKSLGLGSAGLAEEIKDKFPTRKVVRIDADITEQKMYSREAEIIIGTQLALTALDWTKIGLTAIVFADNSLKFPDFRATESIFQRLAHIITQLPTAAQLIIQAQNPEHYLFKALINKNYDALYTKELAERRKFHYPPFVKIIKLIYQDKNSQKCQREAARLSQSLKRKLEKVIVSAPLQAYSKKVRGQYRWYLILKLDSKTTIPTNLIPNNWLIDVEPEDLL